MDDSQNHVGDVPEAYNEYEAPQQSEQNNREENVAKPGDSSMVEITFSKS